MLFLFVIILLPIIVSIQGAGLKRSLTFDTFASIRGCLNRVQPQLYKMCIINIIRLNEQTRSFIKFNVTIWCKIVAFHINFGLQGYNQILISYETNRIKLLTDSV